MQKNRDPEPGQEKQDKSGLFSETARPNLACLMPSAPGFPVAKQANPLCARVPCSRLQASTAGIKLEPGKEAVDGPRLTAPKQLDLSTTRVKMEPVQKDDNALRLEENFVVTTSRVTYQEKSTRSKMVEQEDAKTAVLQKHESDKVRSSEHQPKKAHNQVASNGGVGLETAAQTKQISKQRKRSTVLKSHCNVADCGKWAAGKKVIKEDGWGKPGYRCTAHGAQGLRCDVAGCWRQKRVKVKQADQLGPAGYRCRRHGGKTRKEQEEALERTT